MRYHQLAILALGLSTSALAQEKKDDLTVKIEKLTAALTDKQAGSPSKRIAAEEIGKLGKKGRPATKAVCQALFDPMPRVALAAADALQKIAPDLHPLIIPIIVDKNMTVRMDAVEKLGNLREDATPALPVLVWFRQQRESTGTPVAVLKAIYLTNATDPEATKLFAAWLARDRASGAREYIATTLPKMEGGKKYVKNLVASAQTDPHPAVRMAAVKALGEFGPDAKEAVDLLRVLKVSGSQDLREEAGKALLRIDK